MTLIKDLIEIPEQIQQGDFVLRLAEGVSRAEETLRDYVVTPELRDCFDNALSFIHSGLQTKTSKASYLHGSFGSGKSHFMAVLHLILQGNVTARGIPELAPVIARHNNWIGGKKFLLVPYHMIGSNDMESSILGGYVEFMRRTEKAATIPGVYRAEGLFRDAEKLRQKMGDPAFFAALNEGTAEADDPWGDIGGAWNADRLEAAAVAPPGSEERSQLIGALIANIFGSYDMQAGGHGEAFLPLDMGLSVLSKHAAALGYDGLILFLDELVLWLASHAADLKFVHQEGQKLSKLVEAQTPDRPIPIISFVARQRDLSELIGDAVPGADRLNFADALKHWEGRFHRITLEDRNLPDIAERRVLKPKGEAAKQELDAAFEKSAPTRKAVMDILLTREGDRAMFRKVYPFSPALVQTLIAVSSVLQRERTALRVMMQLLVDHRETLRVGDLVPVGDLFDVVAYGADAFSEDMAIHFENAKRLYHHKLLPLLEKQHGRQDEIDALPYWAPRRVAFRNDDRLVKTLLLSALVPEVESLRALTSERLAALNHGTIKSPIEGREGQEVLRRCRTWAADGCGIRVSDDPNPLISVQLSGVDTEVILRQAEREDNVGNRIRRVRLMIYEQIGVQGEGDLEQYVEHVWKNTDRSCAVLFKNIRELPDSSFENNGEDWKLVIDFPFDEAGHGPKDDLSKLQAYIGAHPEGTKTLCWVPSFFSQDAQKDLGILVILEHILAGERFSQYSTQLSPQDRPAVRSLLDNQKNMLRLRVQSHLDAAYGLNPLLPGSLDTAHDLDPGERFVSLSPGFEPVPPVAANLKGAMAHLFEQALDHDYPAAPAFEAEVNASNLKKVFQVVGEVLRSGEDRIEVDKPLRPLIRGIANPLKLGELGHDKTHFVPGQFWKNHFTRKAAELGTAVEVRHLRRWIDEPRPMGLPKEAANLIILTFALQTNRSFFLHNSSIEPGLTSMDDRCELREQRLPDADKWRIAVGRAGTIFGIASSPLRNASNVAAFGASIRRKVLETRVPCQAYCTRLRGRLHAMAIAPAEGNRLATAVAVLRLLEGLQQSAEDRVVDILADAEVATSETAMGMCVGRCATLVDVFDMTNWEILDAIFPLKDGRAGAADAIRASVAEAIVSDEHVLALGAVLKEAQSKATRLLAAKQPPPPDLPIPTIPGARPTKGTESLEPTPGVTVVEQGDRLFDDLSQAKDSLDAIASLLKAGQTLHLTISWRIEEGGGKG